MCDGIAMGHLGMKYSLASRELIADSTETMALAHCFDGLVLVPNCDKIVPGMVMAAVRLNLPSIVVSGGPMLAGNVAGERTSLSKMFEAVGARKAGLIDDEQLEEFERGTCPGCGSCSGMYTANSMNCLCEAIGIALPGNGRSRPYTPSAPCWRKRRACALWTWCKKGYQGQGYHQRSVREKRAGVRYGAGVQFQQRAAFIGHCA